MASRPETTPEYREALHDLGRGAAAASAVGFFVNLLHLALPLYTIQIYDRVISSGSIDTLVALTLMVAILLGFQAVLDFLRQRIFTILGARVAGRLGQPVFEAAVETARAARAARLDRGNARPRRPAQLRRRRRDRAADGFGGHALLPLRAVPAQPGLWRHRPRRHPAAHRRRAGHRVLRAPPERARQRGRLQRARRHRRGDPQRRGHRRYGDAAGRRAALAAAAGPRAREHRARPGARRRPCSCREDPADRPADRGRRRRRRARHRGHGVRRHHRRRRGSERAAAAALRAADRRLAPVARRLRGARPAARRAVARGADPVAPAGRRWSTQPSPSTASASCRRARTGPCSATCRSASRPASSSA